jgi:outer membrane lipoprotein-sorting protein
MSGSLPNQTDDLLPRAVAAMRQSPAPDGPAPELVSRTLAALSREKRRPRPAFFERISHMAWTSKVSVALAMAASVVVVYLGLLTTAGNSLAFADVVSVLNKVRSAKWKTTTESTLANNQTVKSTGTGMFLSPSHERMEFTFQGSDGVLITDGEKGKILTLDPAGKTAMFLDVENVPAGQESPFGRTFLAFRQLASDVLNDQAGKVQRLGSQTIDGKHAEGFQTAHGGVQVKIWVDPDTAIPVRVEQSSISSVGPQAHTVMSDFQVNVDMDESLFNLDVPQGYSLQQPAKIDLSKDPVQYLADSLKLAAEVNDGVFPPTLRGQDGIDGILLRSPDKLVKIITGNSGELTPDARREAGVKLSMTVAGAFGMLGAMSPEQNDWHYAGKGVKLNAPNQPIFWYRRHKASATYSVLYADLSVKEVPAAEAPKEPAPSGQNTEDQSE